MFFAACSTIIAVFENLIAFCDGFNELFKNKAVVGNLIAIIVLSLPCIFGFNISSSFMPLGAGEAVLRTFNIVSNNLLPIGSLISSILLYKPLWFSWVLQKEANAGSGIKFPGWARFYICLYLFCH